MLSSGEEPVSVGSLLAVPHCCLGGALRGFVLLGGGISPMAAERGKRRLGCSDTGLERDARFIAWRPSRHPRLAPRLRVVRRAFVPAPLGGGISSSPAVCKTPAAISYSAPLPYHAASDGIIPPAGRSPPAPRAASGSPAGHAPQGSAAPAGHPGRARHAPQPRPASPPCPRGAGQPPTHC